MSSPKAQRLAASSSSLSVVGPDTSSPVLELTAPRVPRPCCTVLTCMSYQLSQNVQRMPPWWVESRYHSAAPSHGIIATRCGGWREATDHWFMA